MPLPLDDSLFNATPKFTTLLSKSESNLFSLEATLKQIISTTHSLIQTHTLLSDQNTTISDLITNISQVESTNDMLNTIATTFDSIEKSRGLLIEQLRDTFIEPFNVFIEKVILPVKRAGKDYATAKEGYEAGLNRYMSKPDNGEGVASARKQLHIVRYLFNMQKTLVYANMLNQLEGNNEGVELVVALVYAQFAFYHQGFELLKNQEPMLNQLAKQLSSMKINSPDSVDLKSKIKQDDEYNPVKSAASPISQSRIQSLSTAPKKQGYLYLKQVGALRTTWVKRYFSLDNDTLEIADSTKTSIDLRICMVRRVQSANTPVERQYLFEILSPSKSFILQAENESQVAEWISCLQNAIQRRIQGPDPHATLKSPAIPTVELLSTLSSIPGNESCADCGNSSGVTWASCNLGVLLCIECSGIHRSIGRKTSKVKSLELDLWDESTVGFMRLLGNAFVNSVYQHSFHGEREPSFWKRKWVERAFVKAGTADPTMLVGAVRDGDVRRALIAFAHGADSNSADVMNQTPLHLATLKSDTVMADFLIHWNANVDAQDGDGKTCLHFAASRGDVGMVALLLKRRAKAGIKDSTGRVAVDYAVEGSGRGEEFVKIGLSCFNPVTLLRLVVLDKETRRGDFGIQEALGEVKRSSPVGGAYPDIAAPVAVTPVVTRTSFEQEVTESGGGDFEKFIPAHFMKKDSPVLDEAAADPWAMNRWDDGTSTKVEKKEKSFAEMELEDPF